MSGVLRGHWPWKTFTIYNKGRAYIIEASVMTYKGKRVDYTGKGERGILYVVYRRGGNDNMTYESNVVAANSFNRSILGRWRNTIRDWENNQKLEFLEKSLDFRARKR